MPRYIDADALREHVLYRKKPRNHMDDEAGAYDRGFNAGIYAASKEIDSAPTISPDEVRGVGKWLITDAYPHRVYCSVCYKTYLPNADWELWSDGRIPRNFCPQCGAKMEVSEDD